MVGVVERDSSNPAVRSSTNRQAGTVLDLEQTVECMVLRYAPKPLDRSAAIVGVAIAFPTILALISIRNRPGSMAFDVGLLLAGIVLLGILVACVRAGPPAAVTARFERGGSVEVTVARPGSQPVVTRLWFHDIAELRVFSIENRGSRSSTLLIVPKRGPQILLARTADAPPWGTRIPELADHIRAWAGLPGPRCIALNEAMRRGLGVWRS